MPLHHFYLDLPAAGTEYEEDLKSVEIGRATAVEVYFPLNNNRFSSVWFVDAETDILPSGDGVLTGNGNIQRFDVNEPIRYGKLAMRGINTDPLYSHKIDAWIVIKAGDSGGF